MSGRSGRSEPSQTQCDILIRNFLNREAGSGIDATRAHIREMVYISVCGAGARLDHADLIRDFLVAMGADPYAAVIAADEGGDGPPAPVRSPGGVAWVVDEALAETDPARITIDEQIEQDIGDLFAHMRRHHQIDTTRAVGRLLVSCVTDEMDHNEDVGNGLAASLPRDLAIISAVEASGFSGPQYRPHEEGLELRD